jgi:hypothetical protein
MVIAVEVYSSGLIIIARDKGWILKREDEISSFKVKYILKKYTIWPIDKVIEANITQRNKYLKDISIYLMSRGICNIKEVTKYLINRKSGRSNKLQKENLFIISTYLSILVNSI